MDEIIPAAGQGILAVQDAEERITAGSPVWMNPESRAAAAAERAFYPHGRRGVYLRRQPLTHRFRAMR